MIPVLYAYSAMLEFPGQVLEFNIHRHVGRGTKPPPPSGHLWAQAWTDNDYLNLRVLPRVLFDIISPSERRLEELFLRFWNSPASVCPSNCPSVNISCYRISSTTTDRSFYETWSECSPQCLVVQAPKRIPVRRQTWPSSAIFDFSCYRISSETT